MDPHGVIDAQFNRAVEIVQNFSKIGPMETGYEAKLNMYSLFKQATMGNVQGPRPPIWELLARAKWDAWAKYKDLDAYQAKIMYVEALLKVLRRYSDKTVAMDYVRELESYTAETPDLVMSGSFSRSRSSSSSSSGSSNAGPSGLHYSTGTRQYPTVSQSLYASDSHAHPQHRGVDIQYEDPTPSGEEDDELTDELRPPLPVPPSAYVQQMNRPQSSLSSRRYRTPMASMHMSPQAGSMSVPPTQPMPRFETESAYAEHSSVPPSTYAASTASYHAHGSHLTRTEIVSPPDRMPVQLPYRSASMQPEYTGRPYALQSNPPPLIALERAIQNVQTHLAALSERIDSLETMAYRSTTLLVSGSGVRSPQWLAGNRGVSPPGSSHDSFTFEDMGMWSLILNPLAAILSRFRKLTDFLLYNDNRSPTLVVIRRLMLDVSFLLCVLAVLRMFWRRSGVRRQAVRDTLQRLWWILVGRQVPRVLVDRGV